MNRSALRSFSVVALVASLGLPAAIANAQPTGAQSGAVTSRPKDAPKITGLTWKHQALGAITTIASPRANELFALEARSNDRVIEHYTNGKWTHINVPTDAEPADDSEVDLLLPQVGLSSADAGQFWMRDSIDTNSFYHWAKNTWTRIPGPTVTANGTTLEPSWVADIPGDGAIAGYTAYKDWADSTTYLYRVSDKGTATSIGSVDWFGQGVAENGTVLIVNRDPGGGTLVSTVDNSNKILTIMERRLYAVAAQSSTNAWVGYVTGTCEENGPTPNATCAPGVDQVTSEGTGISLGTSGLSLFNASGTNKAIAATGLTGLQATTEPGTDNAWITGKTASGTTQFYRGTKLANNLA